MAYPTIIYGTPRKLPRASSLKGRVAVLDVAFAADSQGASFDKVTLPFIRGLGERLAMWIDHHDHSHHAAFADDFRFVLCTKAEHGACPEMVTPERVALAGPVDTIVCHVDFDGLASAAKWIREGIEAYPGADADAHAIDTRLGTPSARGRLIDQALRAKPRDDGLKGLVIRYLVEGASDAGLLAQIGQAAEGIEKMEAEAARLADGYEVQGALAVVDATQSRGAYDKTALLLLGQERAPMSLVHDATTVTVAARFDSGIDLVKLLGLSGGMPTRVSVGKNLLAEVLNKLRDVVPPPRT